MVGVSKRLIGLTGGIATGKTTVSNYLRDKYRLPILDADVYAREAVAKGSPILENIIDRYGDKVMLADRSLNRVSLGEIIFNDATEKQWLESQIHPYVRDRFQEEVERTMDDTIVLDIPLLFEANLMDTVTEIWVVSCDRSLQIARLQQRNHLTVAQAEARIDSQIPLADKISAADVVLRNHGDLDYLFAQINKAISADSLL